MSVTDKSPEKQRVTELIARAAYMAQGKPRSLERLRVALGAKWGACPGKTTFENWSKKHEWVRLAAEHDEKTAAATDVILVKKQAKTNAERAEWLMTMGESAIEAGLRDAENTDGASLMRAGIEAMKYAAVLAGGVSDRQTTVTPAEEDDLRLREKNRVLGFLGKIRPVYPLPEAKTNGTGNGKANGHDGDDPIH